MKVHAIFHMHDVSRAAFSECFFVGCVGCGHLNKCLVFLSFEIFNSFFFMRLTILPQKLEEVVYRVFLTFVSIFIHVHPIFAFVVVIEVGGGNMLHMGTIIPQQNMLLCGYKNIINLT
jgi:hypothetical protein